MSEENSGKIRFPCDNYPIKIMGENTQAYRQAALDAVRQHAADIDEGKVTQRESRNGTWLSITVFIRATGSEQLQAIFEELKKLPATRMVL